jgi:hypothetical protein
MCFIYNEQRKVHTEIQQVPPQRAVARGDDRPPRRLVRSHRGCEAGIPKSKTARSSFTFASLSLRHAATPFSRFPTSTDSHYQALPGSPQRIFQIPLGDRGTATHARWREHAEAGTAVSGIYHEYVRAGARVPASGEQGLRRQKSAKPRTSSGASWWTGTESNRRHMDFQSIALPTELPVRNRGNNIPKPHIEINGRPRGNARQTGAYGPRRKGMNGPC